MNATLCDQLAADCRARIERLADECETALLEEAARLDRMQFEALVRLGELYSKLARYREGLAVDLRLSVLAPRDPIVRYNLACSFALVGRSDAALGELHAAIALGYRDLEHMVGDRDLQPLRDLPAFQDLLVGLEPR